jgi:hypothetical protein
MKIPMKKENAKGSLSAAKTRNKKGNERKLIFY